MQCYVENLLTVGCLTRLYISRCKGEETYLLYEQTTEISELLGKLFGYRTARHIYVYTITSCFSWE